MQRTSPIYNCIVPNCKSAYTLNSKERHFFRLPNHEPYRSKWIDVLSIVVPNNSVRVCDLHFDTKFFTSTLRQRLIKFAIPSLQPNRDVHTNDSHITEESKNNGTPQRLETDTELLIHLNEPQLTTSKDSNSPEYIGFEETEEQLIDSQTDSPKDSTSELLHVLDEKQPDNLEVKERIVIITCDESDFEENTEYAEVVVHETNELDCYEEVDAQHVNNDLNANSCGQNVRNQALKRQTLLRRHIHQRMMAKRSNRLKSTLRRQQIVIRAMVEEISSLKQYVRFLKRKIRQRENV